MIYQNLIIEDTNESATEEEFLALQTELGCKIPDDYKEFLLSCNGGYLEYDLLVEFEDGNKEWMSYSSLYTLKISNDWESNPFELLQERKKEGFPDKGVFPIARDGGGSVLYIDLRDGYKIVAFVEGLPGWTGLRCKRPDDRLSHRSYPLLAARNLIAYFIQEQRDGHQTA